MIIGYARVSTEDQKLDAQRIALKKHGIDKLFEEKQSGSLKQRPQLDALLSQLRAGDTLVVTKIDPLGRSVKQLVSLMETFRTQNIHFKCLDDPIDTSLPAGEFFFHIMGAFAQLERALMLERTRAGLHAARARGRQGGRPISISNEKKELAYQLYIKQEKTLADITKARGISRPSIAILKKEKP